MCSLIVNVVNFFTLFFRFCSDGPETTEIIIFAQLNSTADSSNTIQLSVARLTPRPLAQHVQKRVPRPDDPTPRKPPAFFLQELKRAGSMGGSVGGLKRVASGSIIGIGGTKKQKLTNGIGIAADLGGGVRLGAANSQADRVFKVPEMPRQMKGKKEKEKEDVFGDITEVKSGKGKQKSEEGPVVNEMSFEKTNKNVSNSHHLHATETERWYVSLSNEQR